MKILRSLNRRSFSAETAGGYLFLRPSTRFIPAHLQGDFHDLVGQPKKTAFPQVHDSPATAPQFALLSTTDQNIPRYRRLLLLALVVLAAIVLTFSLLWWSAGCPIHIAF
jgi:hypothetical protein